LTFKPSAGSREKREWKKQEKNIKGFPKEPCHAKEKTVLQKDKRTINKRGWGGNLRKAWGLTEYRRKKQKVKRERATS